MMKNDDIDLEKESFGMVLLAEGTTHFLLGRY
jgi:hypothetical protein